MIAFSKNNPFQTSPEGFVRTLRMTARSTQDLLQLIAILIHVSNRFSGNTGIHRRLRDSTRNFKERSGVEWFWDDIFWTVS